MCSARHCHLLEHIVTNISRKSQHHLSVQGASVRHELLGNDVSASPVQARTSHDGGEASTAAATRMDGSVMENELDVEEQGSSHHPEHGLAHFIDSHRDSPHRDSPHRYHRDDPDAPQLRVHW